MKSSLLFDFHPSGYTIPVSVTPKLVEQVATVVAYALVGVFAIEIIKSVTK